MRVGTAVLALAMVMAPRLVGAQQPAPRPPQPDPYAAQPSGPYAPQAQPAAPQPYGPAPGPYAAPYPYAPVVAPTYAFRPPPVLPYREGEPIPVGYHIENRPRKGFVTAGYVVTAIPYAVGVAAAIAANFDNASGYLAVPFVGPWITLGRRDYGCEHKNDPTAKDSLSCVGEVFALMGMIMDGTIQTLGGTFLLIGYTSTKQVLAQDEPAIHIRPVRIGSGYGLGAWGAF